MLHLTLLNIVYIGSFSGPEEVNESCGKMTHMETMDNSFTVIVCGYMNCVMVGSVGKCL